MKMIRNDECFLQFNILGLTLNIPKAQAEARYQDCWFFGFLDIPFTNNFLMFWLQKNFKFTYSIFNKKMELFILNEKRETKK